MGSWGNILNSFAGKPRVAACEIFIQDEGSPTVDVCIIVKKGASIAVTEKAFGLSIQNAKAVIGSDPVFIALAGEHVIHKKIQITKGQDWRARVPLVIPKFRPQDFLIQYTPLDEVSGHLSLVRRRVVDMVVSQLQAEGFTLFDLILGPFALQYLTELMDDGQFVIATGRYDIEIFEKKIKHIGPSSGASGSLIKVAGSVIESRILILYATAIPFFAGANARIEYFDANPAEESRRKFERGRTLRKVTFAGSLVVLVFFVGSAIAFKFSTQRLSDVRQLFGMQAKENQPGENVAAEFSSVRNAIDEIGLTSRHYLSFYADRIAATRPTEIFLTELKIFPVVANPKPTTTAKFNNTVIIVSGACASHEQLARWIMSLGNERWVASIRNQLYHQKVKNKPAAFSFEIHIAQP